MIGAIAGDIIGSVYERDTLKSKDFNLFSERTHFTDDTVLTIATADSLINTRDYTDSYRNWGNKYPYSGYGGSFRHWLRVDNPKPYNSWGNGSAMRVSPIGFFYQSLEEVLKNARLSAEVTHNHPEGIKGAQSTAVAIFLARTGKSKDEIKKYIESTFQYNLSRKLDDIRKTYHFEVSCQKSVPEAIIAFFESENYEDAIRNAISLGGDSDTQACIAGGIAEAFYGGVPKNILDEIYERLPMDLLSVIEKFYSMLK